MQSLATMIDYILNVYIFILLLRIIFQSCRASWYSPMVQFVVAVTKPVVNPVRACIPGCKGVDLSIVVIAFVLEVAKFYLMLLVSHGFTPHVGGVLTYSIIALIYKTLYIFWIAILIWTVLSWVITNQQNPLSEITSTVSYPLVKTVRGFVPSIGGVDLSPLFSAFFLYLLLTFVITPLMGRCFDWAVS